MSELHEALYAHLADDAAVAALVGTRISWGKASEDDALPYIVCFQISGRSSTHLTGASGFATKRIQINSTARTYADSHILAKAVREAVATLKGVLGAGGVTITCKAFRWDGERDDIEAPPQSHRPGSDESLYTVQTDYIVVVTESIPVHA